MDVDDIDDTDPQIGGDDTLGVDETTPLIDDGDELIPMTSLSGRPTGSSPGQSEEQQAETSFTTHERADDAARRLGLQTLKETYPGLSESLVRFYSSQRGKVLIQLRNLGKGGWTKPRQLFNEDGTVRQDVAKLKGFKLAMGSIEEIDAQQHENTERIEELRQAVKRDREAIGDPNTPENVREDAQERNADRQSEIDQLEQENRELEERKPLRDRIAAIFKKYGFTLTAVGLAVATTIAAIVTSLTRSLAKVAQGVGKGLKAIGKKLGELLPGMIGSIANFVFQAAGEAIKFLGENAWLLVLAVTAYLIRRSQRRRD